MISRPGRFAAHAAAFPRWALLIVGLACGAAQAQYKVIGPDGKITYTDRAPKPATARSRRWRHALLRGSPRPPCPSNCARWWHATRHAVRDRRGLRTVQLGAPTAAPARHSVRREAGRHSRRQRGARKTVGRARRAHADARRRRPCAAVRRIVDSYLDAAGYPRESRLPATYQYPAAAPLTERREATPARPAPPRHAQQPPATAATSGPHPGGVKSASERAGHAAGAIAAARRGVPRAARARPPRPSPRTAPRRRAPRRRAPNTSGITALDRLIAIERRAIASPWRSPA